MPKRTRDYNTWLFSQLTDPERAANYINAAIEDSEEMFLIALRNVAEAYKMAKVAQEAGIAREALYKTLSEDGNPRFDTLTEILKAVGLRMAVQAIELISISPTANPAQLTAGSSSQQGDPVLKVDPPKLSPIDRYRGSPFPKPRVFFSNENPFNPIELTD